MKINIFFILFFLIPTFLFSKKSLKNIIIQSNQALIEQKKNEKATEIIYQDQVKIEIEKELSATMQSLRLLINHEKKEDGFFFFFKKPSILYQEMMLSADHGDSKNITKSLTFYNNVIIKQTLSTNKIQGTENIHATTYAEKAEVNLLSAKIKLTSHHNKQVKTEISF